MPQEPASPTLPSPTGPLSGLCLLLAEDNEINRQLVRNILQRAGARVAVAADGVAAVSMLERQPKRFDAVLMDIRMPAMDGYEATRAIRTRLDLADLPIIAMTADSGAAEREKASRAGMNAHVAKPIDPEQLIATLTVLVGKSGNGAPSSAPGIPAASDHGETPLPADLPGIDLRTALIRLGGDRRLWDSLMRQFEASQGGTVAEARRLLATGLDGEAAGALHRLRGVAANLGALEVARLAVAAEAAVKDGPGTVVPPLLAALEGAMGAVFDLARRLPEPDREAPPIVDPVELGQGLAELQKLLSGNNLKAGAVFGRLRPALDGAVASDKIQALSTAIETLDFAEAERLVINMAEKGAKREAE